MIIEPSLPVCSIANCTWRKLETKYAGKPQSRLSPYLWTLTNIWQFCDSVKSDHSPTIWKRGKSLCLTILWILQKWKKYESLDDFGGCFQEFRDIWTMSKGPSIIWSLFNINKKHQACQMIHLMIYYVVVGNNRWLKTCNSPQFLAQPRNGRSKKIQNRHIDAVLMDQKCKENRVTAVCSLAWYLVVIKIIRLVWVIQRKYLDGTSHFQKWEQNFLLLFS